MNKLQKIQARMTEVSDEILAISNVAQDESRDLDEQESARIQALSDEFDKLEADQVSEQKIQNAIKKIGEARVTPSNRSVQPVEGGELSAKRDEIRARVLATNSRVFKNQDDAFLSANFLLGILGNAEAKQRCENMGYLDFKNALATSPGASGGFTVPTPLAAELINLIEQYGVMRQVARRVTMTAPTWSVPKVSGHTVVYYPAENGALTESDMSFEQITLTAKKAAQLSLMSTEITEDSLISVLDTVISDMAWNFAKSEDENGFNGGNGFTGIKSDANVPETTVASVAALSLPNLTSVTASLNNYRGINREWYFNQSLYHGPIQDLLHAAGGTTPRHIEEGGRPTLLGYPVNFVEVLPGADASTSDDLLGIFGDMRQAVYFGDRRSVNFKVLNELYAANDQVGVMSTERYDIVTANPETIHKITIA